MNLENSHQLDLLIDSCKKGKRASQDELYKVMYSYGMSICLRYAHNKGEAHEILNDASLKIFKHLGQYNRTLSFKSWIRRIYINTAIDHYRRNLKHEKTLDISHAEMEQATASSLDLLSANEILAAVQQLSPVYRTTFNLCVIEGYKHNEVAEMLGITESTSRSNLAKARVKLQKMLLVMNRENTGKHG